MSNKRKLTEQEIEQYTMAFNLFDKERKKYLDKTDLKNASNAYGLNFSAKEIDDMFKEADRTKDGKISLQEFMTTMVEKLNEIDSKDEIQEAFAVFDVYGEGVCDEKELSDALLNEGDKLNRQELGKLLEICSVQGVVNYRTFINQIHSK